MLFKNLFLFHKQLTGTLNGRSHSALQKFTPFLPQHLFSFVQTIEMGIFRQLAEYLYLKKRDPNQPRTQWMKYMHGMNRISLLMFVIALLIMLVKFVIIPLFK
jgi:hypothetical protein